MPTVPTDLPEQVRRGLAQLGLDDAALALIDAGDDFVESEKAFRQAGRLEAVRAEAGRVDPLTCGGSARRASAMREIRISYDAGSVAGN